jgi:hypothetical protein
VLPRGRVKGRFISCLDRVILLSDPRVDVSENDRSSEPRNPENH